MEGVGVAGLAQASAGQATSCATCPAGVWVGLRGRESSWAGEPIGVSEAGWVSGNALTCVAKRIGAAPLSGDGPPQPASNPSANTARIAHQYTRRFKMLCCLFLFLISFPSSRYEFSNPSRLAVKRAKAFAGEKQSITTKDYSQMKIIDKFYLYSRIFIWFSSWRHSLPL